MVRFRQKRWYVFQGVSFLALLLLCFVPIQASAQGVGLTALAGNSGNGGAAQEASPEELQRSLDTLIQTLESDQSRQQLVDSLRSLRQAGQAEVEAQGNSQGLLGALADTFNELGEEAESARSPMVQWRAKFFEGWQDIDGLVSGTEHSDLARFAVEFSVLMATWGGIVIILVALGRLVGRRRGWPMDLPRDPKAWLLAAHFLRRMLPWALGFLSILGVLQLVPESAAATGVSVVAYAALCGRILSVVVEIVVSVFTSGHRYPAVRLLQQHALRPLFVIGALIALGDAFKSERLVELLGFDLASLASVLANILATALTFRFIVRFKRPIKHLIRNRSYSIRKDCNSHTEVTRVIGRLWHIPALLLVGASLVAIFVTVGDVGTALARSIINAALLVLTLVVTALLRRQNERHDHSRGRHRHHSEYRRRLERFAYTLGHVLAWLVFAELSLQVWGGSLVGIGREGVASVRIGQAILAIAFTVLLAWLAWIFADTAIQRSLMSSARSRGRRVNQARAQTITPMIRNVVFATIVVIASIVGLANLGVNVTPLLAGAGVIGLALGFGAQTLVQDLITGIFILVEDSLAVDDFVRINGHMGTVEGLTLRTVRLRDLDGIVHILTFSKIESIHNMSRQFGVALMKIRIPFDMKIDDATTMMQETARDLRQDPIMRHHIWSPLEMQGIDRFEDGCAILRMRFRTSPEMQWDVARAFNMLLKRRMEQVGIELGAPRISVSMEGRGGGRLDGSTREGEADYQGATSGTQSDASGRRPGQAGVADPQHQTSATGASPDPA
ncbi:MULTISPECIES: mechanosensitive ion channel family protein [Halomonas]|uniref:mechanosensitive ion channel domain-containing protein n=1 Tax=Halomonas TaxID=2745 RepID=UPI001A903343|nr:mechanosensitive ion channel [Halomonas litopenaei]MBY5928349.1 mechanosensitive ion channel [Halomonas sp. DP8Y7-3]MBY5967117.1 mechanosensitive ion channel [Halomonas denitrificans]MBY6029409.1 mechanosensitive ion channel [Halomonas sp. DP8Y7-1]